MHTRSLTTSHIKHTHSESGEHYAPHVLLPLKETPSAAVCILIELANYNIYNLLLWHAAGALVMLYSHIYKCCAVRTPSIPYKRLSRAFTHLYSYNILIQTHASLTNNNNNKLIIIESLMRGGDVDGGGWRWWVAVPRRAPPLSASLDLGGSLLVQPRSLNLCMRSRPPHSPNIS
jgi:hypothetical protein